MDLILTRSLLAVARHGAITEAARALGVTQPALSRRIQLLEQELNAELFERSRRGVSLTEAGRIAVAQGKQLVERFDRMRDDLRAHRDLEAGTVRLGGGATAVAFLLPPAIAGFQSDHPGVRFQVKEAGSREVEADVIAERLELGVVTLPVRTGEVTVRPLREDRIVPIAARDHPLAARQRIRAARLSEYGVVGFEAGSAIRQLIDASLQQAGVEMNVVMELRSIPAIVAMVSATRNLAFVSDLGVDGKDGPVCRLAVQGLRISRRLAIVSKRGRPLSPAALAFSEKLGQRGRRGSDREG